MVLKFFRGQDGERLEQIERKMQIMLELDREEFEMAMAALLGEAPAADVSVALRARDRKVNQLEREIRRELMVHASVFGGIDTPAVLLYMSLVKDIERIGDYAKNLVDLARDGVDFSQGPDPDLWRRLRTDVSTYIADAGHAFRVRDEERSRRLLTRGGALLREFDERVSLLVKGSDDGPLPVARALGHRYFKRVVAHLMNILTAVVMPVDKIDYFDEDPEDRH